MNSDLLTNIESLEQEYDLISAERKEELQLLAVEINDLMTVKDSAKVTFVCTHNSRRSQLSEIWLRTAADYFNITGIESYSGGTESTAFNHRMVAAVERFGFLVEVVEESDNPEYRIRVGTDDKNDLKMFSKKYDHEYNPSKDFIAVMVCGQADKDCPFVPGATQRMALPYLDPKSFDNTNKEAQAYDDKVREIGREVLYMMSYLAT